jgi:hypothetical protein
MLVTQVNEWGLIISSADSRPAAAMGTAVTPVQNGTGGTYAQLLAGASVTHDVYQIDICVNSVSLGAATARDAIATLGIDPAGGSSYTAVASLVVGPASNYTASSTHTVAGGTWFRFPYFIKAGSSIGIRGSVNSATVTAFSAFCHLYCKPSHPEYVWAGSYIDAFGVDTATSAGTTIVPGGASEGSWTEIGTLTRPCRYLEFGYGINDTTMAYGMVDVDIAIGDATNKKIVCVNRPVQTSVNEALAKPLGGGGFGIGAVGDKLYARAWCGTGVPDSANSIAIYAVG